MLGIQKKILSFMDNGRIPKKKINVMLYIYDDIVKLQEEGTRLKDIQNIINTNEIGFSITLKTLYNYITRVKIYRKKNGVLVPDIDTSQVPEISKDNSQIVAPEPDPAESQQKEIKKYPLDLWISRAGVTNEKLIKKLEDTGFSLNDVVSWGCTGNFNVSNRLTDERDKLKRQK